jgi:hypothetical protein
LKIEELGTPQDGIETEKIEPKRDLFVQKDIEQPALPRDEVKLVKPKVYVELYSCNY